MKRPRLGASILAAACLLSASPARADEPGGSTILLVVSEKAVALSTRVAAELTALGFSVQQREPGGSELVTKTRQAGVFAAISIQELAQGGVEITVLDRVTGKTVRRELPGRSLEDATARELIALQASELLRASLMEVQAPHPPRGDVPPSPVVRDVASSPRTLRRVRGPLRFGVDSGVLVAPGFSAAPALELGAGLRLGRTLRLTAGVGSQLSTSRREEPEGTLEVLPRWATLGARIALARDDAALAVGVEAGFALVALSASGFAHDPDFAGRSAFVWLPGGFLGLDSATEVVDGLWWTLRPRVYASALEPSVRIAGREVATWGQPWLRLSTGLELVLP